MWRGGCEVGEAATPEDTKLVVGRIDAEEEGERRGGAGGATWTPVDEVCRRGQCLSPERQRCCAMKKHCANTIVKCTKHALSLPILLRSIGTGEAELDPMFSEKKPKSSGIELLAVVCLQSQNGEAELSLDIGEEGTYSG